MSSQMVQHYNPYRDCNTNKHTTHTLLLRLLLLLRHLPFTTHNSNYLRLQKGETSVHVQRENRRLIAVVVVLFMERFLQWQREMMATSLFTNLSCLSFAN